MLSRTVRVRPVLAVSMAFAAALAMPAAEPKSEDGWVNLFNGKDLAGWVQHSGKAKYTVENGEIVGRTAPNTENSFLCTAKEYGDFVLELDFKVHPKLNSGVQIRSHFYEKATTVELRGGKRTFPADRMYGYQVEIDPSDRAYTGGIYDEARRGVFLADLKNNEAGRKAFKQNDWNHFRIECKGDSMKVWLNGVQTADLKDSMTPSGFIGLQVHQNKSAEPLDVHFKNIKLKELK